MQTELLKVTGMTCGGCTGSVADALKAVAGVETVSVSLSTGEATVKYEGHLTSPQHLIAAVKGAGFGVDAGKAAGSAKTKGCCCA